MGFCGSDTAQLRSYAASVSSRASRLAELADQLDNAISAVTWEGHDADVFRDRWRVSAKPGLLEIAQALQQRSSTLDHQAEEQDAASGTNGERNETQSGGSQEERQRTGEEGPRSDGFFGDLLGGQESALFGNLAWNTLSTGLDAWGMVPGTAATAVGLPFDIASTGIGLYDAAQSFQDGELFGTIDGLTSSGINGADSVFGVMSLVPEPHVAAAGEVGGIVTGSLDMAWSGATALAQGDAMQGGDHGGSTSRFLLESIGVPDAALGTADGLFGVGSGFVRDRIPIIDPMIDSSQDLVENVVPEAAQAAIENGAEGASSWVDEHVPWWH